ncbi:hypothetical protein [Psychroflexus maritimus]|uniref:Uncharacterized protein n=1 Tax=Psychroflexus maritimus TaxID=2714865 RepID=A0A967AEE0_9FLAO|nr:hypothetical protein [Psychroflexus maritimus]NGZ90175.1 hypothetical protein [Psychroflexus maritimus]
MTTTFFNLKKHVISIFIILFSLNLSIAQVGIGTTDPKTTLQIEGEPTTTTTADGVRAPMLTLAQLNAKISAYGSDQDGVIVYINDVSTTPVTQTANINATGYYFYDASNDVWKSMGGTTSPRAPEIIGWLGLYNDASSTAASERTIGNLQFRWNPNNHYLEVKTVSSTNFYEATMKHYSNTDGFKTYIGSLTSSYETQYSSTQWKPIYTTSGNNPPVGLNSYNEIHIEIYEQIYEQGSFNISEHATYSIKTFLNGYSEISYIVTYNILMP